MKEFISHSENETIEAAKKFAKTLKPGAVIALEGDLGSGKTTFIKGVALGLGLKDPDEVKSPTFAIMHIYPTRPELYHFDLYRMEASKEISDIGFEDFINDPSLICCVEWPKRAKGLLPDSAIWIHFKVSGENSRKISFD